MAEHLIDPGIVKAHNRQGADALAQDYEALARALAAGRRLRSHPGACFRAGDRGAVLGRRHRRDALRALSRPGRARRHLRPVGGLRRRPAAWPGDTARLAAFPLGRYGDDDLDAGSVDPFRLFLVFNELADAEARQAWDEAPALMLDRSHNVTDPIESLMLSADAARRAHAQALLVDREQLAGCQAQNDVAMAAETLRQAYRTDVTPLLAEARRRAGGAIDPIGAYRLSSYRKIVAARLPQSAGSGGGIV